jgi:polyhydroxyalkanoate synthase
MMQAQMNGLVRTHGFSDPMADAFRAAQQIYKAGLLAHVNQRRKALRKKALDWPEVGATPKRPFWTEGSATLYRYDAPASRKRPLLLVCSLINRPYVLDLLEERSVVRRLLASGRDVWLLDWGDPTEADRGKGLAEYALELLPAAAEEVRRRASADRIHVLGYCMGGTFALMAAAAGKLPIEGLVAMATPVALHDSGLLSVWSRTPGFDPGEVTRAYGHAPPHLLQPAFKMLDPVGMATKLLHLEERLEDDDFVRFFLAMETWLEDSVSFPGRAFAEWVDLYRTDALARGELKLGDRTIDLSKIETPILSLIAEGDYITPPVSSLAIETLAPRAEQRVIKLKGGHIGLATGAAAHGKMWPEVGEWLASHDAPDVPAQAPKKKGARR